jgi:hypothetical protein
MILVVVVNSFSQPPAHQETEQALKFQYPNPKFQINPNFQFQMTSYADYSDLRSEITPILLKSM